METRKYQRRGVRSLFLCAAVLLLGGALAGQQESPDIAAPQPSTKVFVIPVRGEINDLMRDFIKRGLKDAEAAGAAAVVLDMDTYGGAVSSAMDISEALKATKLRKVVWVHSKAISAGALISLACDEIVIADHAKIGDCAPIMVGPEGMVQLEKTERAKIDSVILAEFRDSGKARGYPLRLCEAMVTLGPAVYRIAHKETKEKKFVHSTELRDYGLRDPEKESAAPVSAVEGWEVEKKVLSEDKLLTMVTDEAIEYGFAKAKISNKAELVTYLGAASADLVTLEMNWVENLVEFLTSPIVRGLLSILMIMALYSEMQTPGLGLAGAVAAAALLVLLGAPYLTGMANVLEIFIILLGITLVAVEVFVPTGGLAGVAGLILVLFGLVMTFVPSEPGPGFLPRLPGTWDAITQGTAVVFGSLAISCVGMAMLTRYLGTIPLFRRLVLTAPTAAAVVAPGGGTSVPVPEVVVPQMGQTGVVTAMLKPTGRAQFGGPPVDVSTRGEMVEPGQSVRIVEVQGTRVIVERAT